MADAMATAGAAMDLVNKGVETITKVLRPRTSEIKVVEGGFAKCLPDGVSDSDLDGGDIRIFRAVSSAYHGERAKEMLGDVLGGALGRPGTGSSRSPGRPTSATTAPAFPARVAGTTGRSASSSCRSS